MNGGENVSLLVWPIETCRDRHSKAIPERMQAIVTTTTRKY